MIICGSHMHKFSDSKDTRKTNNNDRRRRDMVVEKVVAHLCLTLIIWKNILTMIKGEGIW
jgi:hypothetical protein